MNEGHREHPPPLGFVRGVTTKKSHFFRPMDSQSVAEHSPIACLTLLSLRLPSCFLYFCLRSAHFTLSLFPIQSSEERPCMALMPSTPHADASSCLTSAEPIEHAIGFIPGVKHSQLPFPSLPSAPLPFPSPPLPTLCACALECALHMRVCPNAPVICFCWLNYL